MTYTGSAVRVKQDFTDNKAALREVFERPDLRQGRGRRRRPRSGDRGDRVRAERRRVQRVQHRSPAVSAADRVHDAAADPRAEVAGLLRQQPASERHRQQRPAPGDDQRRDPRQRQIFPVDARGLVASAPLGDATQRSPGGIGMFSGAAGGGGDVALPALAGHPLRAGEGHRRQGDVRLQRPVARHRAGGGSADQLLHHRLLQHAYRERRQVPPRQGRRWPQPARASWPTARATTPTRSGRR